MLKSLRKLFCCCCRPRQQQKIIKPSPPAINHGTLAEAFAICEGRAKSATYESLAATKQEPFSQQVTSLEWTTEDEAMLDWSFEALDDWFIEAMLNWLIEATMDWLIELSLDQLKKKKSRQIKFFYSNPRPFSRPLKINQM
jgi:hypothetical protein